MMPPLADDTMRRKKDATIHAIIDAAGALLIEKMGAAPHAREIAAKSGFSVGTIYNYFTSVGDVVSHLVLMRQTEIIKRIEAIILAHQPDHPVASLCAQIVDALFASYSTVKPNVLRFAYTMAVAQAAKPELHDKVVERLAQPIHAAVKRDKTGTFCSFEDQELIMYLRAIAYLCRYPLLEGSLLFGTPDHQRIILSFLIRMMSTPNKGNSGPSIGTPAV
jgi:AcrR family transcriptional regulator